MKTRLQLCDWALWVYDSKWLYAMGTYGQRLQTHYPILAKSWYYTSKNPEGFKVLTAAYQRGENPRLYDCHGIVDGFRMDDDRTAEIDFDPSLDISADMEYKRVIAVGVDGKDFGKVDGKLIDNRGYGYWKSGHFGVGVGDGRVLDIWSTGYPARIRDQNIGSWQYWVKCYGIDYEDGSESEIMIKSGDGPNQAVYDLQTAYQKLGYNIGAFKNMLNPAILDGRDGEYGSTCIGITNKIKAKYGLAQDGIVDADTYGKIALELIAIPVPVDQSAKVASLTAELAKVNNLYIVETNITGNQAVQISNLRADLKQFANSVDQMLALKTKYII
jgi:hypothetical protein